MSTKHQTIFMEMLNQNRQAFEDFKVVHDNYMQDRKKWQKDFNQKGEKITDIIRKYESILCSKSDSGTYSKYSGNLAEKFWEEIRKYFPMINFVGVEIY